MRALASRAQPGGMHDRLLAVRGYASDEDRVRSNRNITLCNQHGASWRVRHALNLGCSLCRQDRGNSRNNNHRNLAPYFLRKLLRVAPPRLCLLLNRHEKSVAGGVRIVRRVRSQSERRLCLHLWRWFLARLRTQTPCGRACTRLTCGTLATGRQPIIQHRFS